MKDQTTVIKEFNDIVNMTVPELETWLKSDDSQSAGWPKGDEGAESVGHDSGRNIISILKSNPDKDPEKYTEDHIQHMRKVVSYCKRHLAQEEKTNREKSAEEVKKTKSYASLKNWGHDILKKNKGGIKANETKNGDSEQQTGDKRKADDKSNGANKKRETEKGRKSQDSNDEEKNGSGAKANGSNGTHDTRSKSNGAVKKTQEKDEGDAADEEGDNGEELEDDDEAGDEGEGGGEGKEQNQGKDDEEQEKEKKKNDKGGEKPAKGPKPGDTVSWNWGNGQPEGKVLDVKGEKTTVETKNGNEVSRKGDAEDPAVVIDTGKSEAIKSAHELN